MLRPDRLTVRVTVKVFDVAVPAFQINTLEGSYRVEISTEETIGGIASDQEWMQRALKLALYAETQGEVPIGAVVVKEGRVIAEGSNSPIGTCDPTAHAEIVALRHAGRLQSNYRLMDCTLYVTLEPCVMCMGAIVHARVRRLVFGAFDPQRGAAGSVLRLADADFLNHRVECTGGVLAEECGALLKRFFRHRRA